MQRDGFPRFDRRSAIVALAGGIAAATGGCSEMFPYRFRFSHNSRGRYAAGLAERIGRDGDFRRDVVVQAT